MTLRGPLLLSSGDLIADRRYEHARALAARGDTAAACELLVQALERAPTFAAAAFTLGELREQAGDREGAVAAFRAARASDPADRHGAALHLARLEGRSSAPMPAGYLRALFDQYAPGFEAALTAGLSYRAPQLLRGAVETLRDGRRFKKAVDLGCGTGLCGEAFRDLCDSLAGIDISPAMVELARRKSLYERLEVGDMAVLLAEQAGTADLLIAADAFCYVEDLGAICRAAATALTPGGLLAFSVETHAGDGVRLSEKLRYQHASGCVRAALAGAELSPLLMEPAATRTENAAPVPGLIVVAARVSSGAP